MGNLDRVRAFVERNRGAVFSSLVQQSLVRVWIRLRLWRVFGFLFPHRTPERWVFVGGCYNSGTTILREMIGAHPRVSSLPREGVQMTDAFPNLEAGGWERMWYRNARSADLSARNPEKVAYQAIRDWGPWWRKEAGVFIEKSIVHGAWMPFLQDGFENAYFLGVIRNGYCVCEGIRRRASPKGAARETVGSDVYPIEQVGEQWVFANQIIERDKGRLNHYHEIRYEDFTGNPVHHIREIFRFIGVDDSVVMQEEDGTITIGSRSFAIRSQNAESFSRLTQTDRAKLGAVIGPMMKQLGYDAEEEI